MEIAANKPEHGEGAGAAVGAAAAHGASTTHRVPLLELITKSSCHLCVDARDVVAGIAGELGLPWQEVAIDDDAELTARYGEEIPVVMVDGVQRDFWHIDPDRLRKILLQARGAA